MIDDSQDLEGTFDAATPWFTSDAVTWLDANILPSDRVFEIGGGRSSLYFTARAQFTHTLETSPTWARLLIKKMSRLPALLRAWQIELIPVDWTPTWRDAQHGFWGQYPSVLTKDAARRLEKRYLLSATSPKDATVLVLDGGLRSHLYVLFDRLDRLKDFEVVIIDNTEFDFAAYWYERHPPEGFARYDFVAGSLDKPDENVQHSKHITTIFVRQDRNEKMQAADYASEINWTFEDLQPHRIDEDDEETRKRVQAWEKYVRAELTGYGL